MGEHLEVVASGLALVADAEHVYRAVVLADPGRSPRVLVTSAGTMWTECPEERTLTASAGSTPARIGDQVRQQTGLDPRVSVSSSPSCVERGAGLRTWANGSAFKRSAACAISDEGSL